MRRPVSLLAAGVLVAGVLVAGVAGVGASTAAEATAATRPEARYAHQASTATNAQRTQRGLAALRANDCLEHAARRQARRMAQRERMFHQDLDAVLKDCGLGRAGENVASGYPTGRSVVEEGWMASEGHRANILDPRFRLMGIGARQGHDGRWYVAQVLGRKG